MLFRTHVFFGIFVWLVLDLWISMPWLVFFFVIFGSFFVDVDSSTSKIARKFWLVSWIFKHRGFFHSLVGCFLISLLVAAINRWAGFGFFVGYLSHLVIDCFTRAGVRLFWPSQFRVRGFVKSGGWVEDVLFVFLLVLNIGFLVYKFL